MTTSNNELEEKFTNVSHLQELLHSIYSDVRASYDVLDKHEDDLKYSLSLTYLSMSHQSYLEFKRVYYQNGLVNYEIDPFLKDYEQYKLQLKEVITERDSNTSWLYSAFNTFTNTKSSVDEFLSDWIKGIVK